MIEIPVYLAVVQWVLLVTLAFLVVVVYRQLAQAIGVGTPARERGLPIGSSSAAFTYVRLRPVASGAGRFEPGSGRPSLLLFADPSCQACDVALRELEKAARSSPLDGLAVLVVTTEPETNLAASDAFRATGLPLAMIGEDVLRDYRVDSTPLAYGIGPDGVIRARSVPSSAKELRALARAAARRGPEAPAEAAAEAHGTHQHIREA
jgi:hypothetical protein